MSTDTVIGVVTITDGYLPSQSTPTPWMNPSSSPAPVIIPEVQNVQLRGYNLAGSFQLVFNGEITAPIPFNAAPSGTWPSSRCMRTANPPSLCLT